MHRVVQDEIENVLANPEGTGRFRGDSNMRLEALAHLEECALCREELSLMQQHSLTLRQLRVSEEMEPRPGFYARVLERIEAEGPVSIWNLFMESAFGRRIAVASLALAVLLGVYLISSEQVADDPMIASEPASVQAVPAGGLPNDDVPVSNARMVVGRELPADDFVQINLSQFGVAASSINRISVEQSSDDAVLTNLMTYREQ